MSKKKRDHHPDAVEARRVWAKEQLLANPYMHTYSGPDNLLDAMTNKFGAAIDTGVLGQIKKEVLAEKGLTSEQVMAHQRSHKVPKKPKPSTPTAYFAKQLALVAKMLRERLPDLTRFELTTDEDGKAAIEYTLRQMSEVTGKVKL
jgi:hypothetical protein